MLVANSRIKVAIDEEVFRKLILVSNISPHSCLKERHCGFVRYTKVLKGLLSGFTFELDRGARMS